jgi:hypothetical protein
LLTISEETKASELFEEAAIKKGLKVVYDFKLFLEDSNK